MNRACLAGGWALAAWLLAPGSAPAAWDNVFQLTCCGTPPRVANKPCCPPPPCCPQQAYVQRSYYQPMTSYKPVVSYDPVVSYRTSYYYEPVQSYSYSMYVDPCTGCASQVATPQTCYQLKQQCNAVTNYVQRISYQPVVSYRQSFYYDPVTVNPCNTCSTPAVVVAPAPYNPPVATEGMIAPSTPAPPLNQEPRTMPNTTEKTFGPNGTSMPRPAPATVRPDRMASRASTIEGTIVRSDFRAQPGARIQFVSANGQQMLPATADATGRFNVNLASGSWRIYTEDSTGRPTYHSDIAVRQSEARNVMVVSR